MRTSRLQLERFAKIFGKRTVATLGFAEIKEWLNGMPVKVITKLGYRRALKSLFNFACKRKFAPSNPIDDIRLPKPKEEPIEIFTPAEVLFTTSIGRTLISRLRSGPR